MNRAVDPSTEDPPPTARGGSATVPPGLKTGDRRAAVRHADPAALRQWKGSIVANDPNWRLPEVAGFTLESPEFRDGEPLPSSARADGGNRSPALAWSGAPAGTKSFAVTLYDPDAPTGSGFWHWAAYNLPGTLTSLAADAGNPENKTLPGVTINNEMRAEQYMGAAPPPGDGEHRYFFTVSALDIAALEIPADATPAVLGFTMREHIIGRAQLMGLSNTPA